MTCVGHRPAARCHSCRPSRSRSSMLRSRRRSLLPLALAVPALLVPALVGLAPSSVAATPTPSGPYYFHSAAGSYSQDATADPQAVVDGRAPGGAKLTATAPTKTADSTAVYQGPGLAGSPTQPTFSVPVAADVRGVCFDVWLSNSSPQVNNSIDLLSTFQTPAGDSFDNTTLSITPY